MFHDWYIENGQLSYVIWTRLRHVLPDANEEKSFPSPFEPLPP